METNVSKKELQNLSIGLEMLADRQHDYIKAVADITIVLHANALHEDILKQPNDPECANELLSSLIHFLSALSIENSRFLQCQINDYTNEPEHSTNDYKEKYMQLLVENKELHKELRSIKELQNN